MKENGSPRPELETDEDRSYFLIRPPAHLKAESDESARSGAKEKTSGKTSGKIIELILQNASITIPEMASKIGITERSIERNIRKLQAEDKLKRIGPAKGGHWVVREDA
jgi:predicted HTH transcriptional regulator